MPNLTTGMSAALKALDLALDAPRREGVSLGNWRWLVRQRMAAVRDALLAESLSSEDGWLAARGGAAFRERNTLLERTGTMSRLVLEAPDAEQVRLDLKRLLADINRHLQRLRDIAYDEVELELGGSE